MLPSQEVAVGKFYVNQTRNVARQVVEIRNNAIIFINYHLNTGASTGTPSECMKQHFTLWADREASQSELTRLKKKSQML